MTEKNTIAIVDDNGIELLVDYFASDDGMDDGVFVELEAVELVMGGVGLNLLSHMTKLQKDWLEQKVADQLEWVK